MVWYKVKTPDGYYFTPFAKGGYDYKFLGDGSKDPTPKELAEFLDKNQDWFHDEGVLKVYNPNKLKGGTVKSVPYGIYEHEHKSDDDKERLSSFSIRNDSFVPLDNHHEEIKQTITDFLNSHDYYCKTGLLFKLGILLYGRPGNGKTLRIQSLIRDLFVNKAVVIFINNRIPSNGFLNKIKDTLGDTLKVFIFEELASSTDDRYIENLLAFLDGELSSNNSIIFATTNFPEKLPANVVDRASRFDKIYEFKDPNAKERDKLLKFFLQTDNISQEYIDSTKGLTIADLKEVCLRVIVNRIEFNQAVREMKLRHDLCKKAFAKSEMELGFGFSKTSRYEFDD